MIWWHISAFTCQIIYVELSDQNVDLSVKYNYIVLMLLPVMYLSVKYLTSRHHYLTSRNNDLKSRLFRLLSRLFRYYINLSDNDVG